MHGTKGVVEVGRHLAACGDITEQTLQQSADDGNRLPRISDLEPHQQYEREPEQQKCQCGHPVLDTDDLVVRGEDVAPQKTDIMVMMIVLFRVIGCLSFRYLHVLSFSVARRRLRKTAPD